jgi:hypothetical protein
LRPRLLGPDFPIGCANYLSSQFIGEPLPAAGVTRAFKLVESPRDDAVHRALRRVLVVAVVTNREMMVRSDSSAAFRMSN